MSYAEADRPIVRVKNIGVSAVTVNQAPWGFDLQLKPGEEAVVEGLITIRTADWVRPQEVPPSPPEPTSWLGRAIAAVRALFWQ